MYKLAEKELLEEREKLEKEFEPAEQELNEIKAKLEKIAKYDDLKNDNYKYVPTGILGLIIGILCSNRYHCTYNSFF